MQTSPYPVKKGKTYHLKIDSLAFGGHGVARKENYVIFVKNGLPGDLVNALIIKRKKSHAEAVIKDIVNPSDMRIKAPCPYFGFCGGCTWQNLSYEQQLIHKQKIVADSLQKTAALNADVLPIISAEKDFGYRNKMEFTFAHRKWLLPKELEDSSVSKEFALGFHVPGAFDKILQIDECLLQSDNLNEILKIVSDFAGKSKRKAYNLKDHSGFWRFLVLRESNWNGDILVNFVTAFEDLGLLKDIVTEINARVPKVKTIVNNINAGKALVAVGEKEILLFGPGYIEDKIGSFIFLISANSFFQTNTTQAEKLYNCVIDFLGLEKKAELIWDLYCGTGSISLFLADYADKVVGFEITESAIKDAKKNAQKYFKNNIDFISGDVRENINKANQNPDIIVTDPPRSGMHKDVIKTIQESGAKKIIYVSCNPATMARDIFLLSENYDVRRVQPVDMFPQTYHIECVTELAKK